MLLSLDKEGGLVHEKVKAGPSNIQPKKQLVHPKKGILKKKT